MLGLTITKVNGFVATCSSSSNPISFLLILYRHFLSWAFFDGQVTQQHNKLQELGHSQHGEPDPQTQLPTNVGHKGYKLLKEN